jgi:hypothetical protein
MKNKREQFFKKNRRGELTTKQLVTIIILIVSFVIVLFILFRLNLGETTNKEICHNSVVLKGQSAFTSGPLDCRTNYLCISGGGNCQGIPTTSEVKVDADKEDEIMKALADEMSDCRWMFGEDKKVPYTGGALSTGVHCAICSIVEFDKEIQESIPKISYSAFYDYLKTTKKEGSQTYLNYLYRVNDENLIGDGEYFNFDLSEAIDTSEKYSIITGIDNNLIDFVGDDKWLTVHIIPTSETSRTKCDEFITKS